MKDLLSVPEFAIAAGKKKQGIYQQVKNENSKIAPYVVYKGKTAYIKKEALKELYGIEQADSQAENQDSQIDFQDSQIENQESQADSQAENQESQTKSQAQSQEKQAESQGRGTAEEQEKSFILFLQEQLKEKDRQIAEKDKQIEKITLLLNQEQQLHARTTYLLTEYQKKEAEQEETAEEAEQKDQEEADTGTEEPQAPQATQEQAQEPQKKRSWLYRFFFGDE